MDATKENAFLPIIEGETRFLSDARDVRLVCK